MKLIDSLLFHNWLIIWPHKSHGSFKITNSKAMHWIWCSSPSKDIKYFFSLLEVNEPISRLPSILLLAVRGLIKTCIGICSAGSLIDLLFLFHCFLFLFFGGCVLIDMYLCISVYIHVSLSNQISPFRSEFRCAYFWRSLQKSFLFLRLVWKNGHKMGVTL